MGLWGADNVWSQEMDSVWKNFKFMSCPLNDMCSILFVCYTF